MEGLRYSAIRLVLSAIALSRLDRVLAPKTRGLGCILTFHRVCDEQAPLLPENAGLDITPAFLDAVLSEIRRLGYDIIALDDLPARMDAKGERPFVVLTFDDGYRDLRDCALPVLRSHGAPFTAFICTGFADRTAPLWWLDLEAVVRRAQNLRIALPDGEFEAPCHGEPEKRAALRALYWRLRQLDEAAFRNALAVLLAKYEVDPALAVSRLCMDWAELAAFSRDPLVTIGAHSLTHPRLAQMPDAPAREEMALSRDVIAARLGVQPHHFCYPVGDPGSAGVRESHFAAELGYACALTTRPDVVRPGADLHLLPRISVNGLFQRPAYLRALMSGVPFWRP